MARHLALALLATAAFLGIATAQTTNLTRYDGFSYAGNVIGYVNMTIDFCDIKAAIAGGNFTRAAEIYSLGKNSFSGVSKRTFFRFASYVTAATSVEPLHDTILMGKNTSWLDNAIRTAFADGKGALATGLIQVGAMKYMMHEIDEAYNKIQQYLADPANLTVLVSDAAGAPHNVDEAFALWAGGAKSDCGTLSGWAASLGAAMQTTFLGKSYINSAMSLAMNEFLASSRMVTVNLAAYDAMRTQAVRILTMLGLQGVAVSTYTSEAAAACKRPAAEMEEAMAMTTVHWTYLEPMLKMRKVPQPVIKALGSALMSSKPSYKKVAAASKKVLSAMGRRTSELGVPDADRIKAGWMCKA